MDEERGAHGTSPGSRSEELASLAAAVDEPLEAEESEEFGAEDSDEGNTHQFDFDDEEDEDAGIERFRNGYKAVPLHPNNQRAAGAAAFSLPRSRWEALLHRTLLPDAGFSVRGHAVLESSGVATKLLKFVIWTFCSIAVVHEIVARLFDDRDRALKLSHIWHYEADLIVRDCFVFFVVGRMWEKPGIDHLAWMGTAVLSNVYFESQNFVWFLQHSVTLFEMHCLWPWELWLFALALVVAAAGLVLAHAWKAWRDRFIVAKLTELGLCVLFFMAPMVTSDFFHLHHWYAGWLMGMQFNYDVWWSRLAMAWCWGMYVNGIAVYGRDPVLTCEYAYFLTLDNRCPYISCYLEGLADANNTKVKEMVPVDWRNCSATDDFHP